MQVASDQARLPPEAWVEKIDAWLVHELIAWRRDLAYARCTGSDDRADPDRRLSVEVEYVGEDLLPLREAELETGFDRDGVVSGLVHMRALEALARVPAVVRIHAEPPSEPTAAHSRGHDTAPSITPLADRRTRDGAAARPRPPPPTPAAPVGPHGARAGPLTTSVVSAKSRTASRSLVEPRELEPARRAVRLAGHRDDARLALSFLREAIAQPIDEGHVRGGAHAELRPSRRRW